MVIITAAWPRSIMQWVARRHSVRKLLHEIIMHLLALRTVPWRHKIPQDRAERTGRDGEREEHTGTARPRGTHTQPRLAGGSAGTRHCHTSNCSCNAAGRDLLMRLGLRLPFGRNLPKIVPFGITTNAVGRVLRDPDFQGNKQILQWISMKVLWPTDRSVSCYSRGALSQF